MDEYAWDDVNNMELPNEKVRGARREDMRYMKEKTFNGQGPYQHKVGRYGH